MCYGGNGTQGVTEHKRIWAGNGQLHDSHQSIKDKVLKAMRKYKPKTDTDSSTPTTLSKIRAKLRRSKEGDMNDTQAHPQPALPQPNVPHSRRGN